MNRQVLIFILILWSLSYSVAQDSTRNETNLAGVFQGKPLFIQNPYDKINRQFCVDKIYINERALDINYKLSAIKLDFSDFDLYTPVKVQIVHKDTVCVPIIINPESILFHTIFRFESISLTDTALVWSTKGEAGIGKFEVERLQGGVWVDQKIVSAIGKYEGSSYTYYPSLEEGHNKYRIKYLFPQGSRGKHLFSWELDYDHYPDPVEFQPKSTREKLILSRSTPYEIYDAGSKKVLTGQGKEIDVRGLRRGQYVIYFDGKDPGSFLKE